MCKVYGYARISTSKQSIERQIRNIKNFDSSALIYREAFTGTKSNRPELEKLLKVVKAGDTIIFDSVSRMSRNADDGFALYKELFEKGITLVFLKERYVDTATYRKELEKQVNINIATDDTATNELMNGILTALNIYVMNLAERQIKIAFEQSEKEVFDLRQRTREGLETARRNGKVLGGYRGKRKNEAPIKELIIKHSKSFKGTLKDSEVIALINGTNLHVSNNTFYKYKKQLKNQYNY